MESLTVPACVAPPSEAYRYWPTGPNVSYGEGKKLVRLIFYKVRFTDYEEQQLQQFEAYMRDRHPAFAFPQWLGREERVRVLLGCKFDMRKSAEAVFSSIEWRSTCAPNSFYSLFDHCAGVLQSGAIYIHGRDHRYRPLLVLNVGKLDLKQHAVAEYRALICFLLEFMTKEMLIPGQVENWVVVTDLCRTSLFDLPISELKSLIKLLQDNFRCRMTVNYVVNSPTSITWAWKVIKVVVEEHTIKKIRILSESVVEEMRSHFAPSQYEEKYGGGAPNATKYWPPTLPDGPYTAPGEPLEAHLSANSSYFEYFPTKEQKDTDSFIDRSDTDLRMQEGDKMKAEFVRIPMIKQETEDVPEPEFAPPSEYVSCSDTGEAAAPQHSGCCGKCRRGKCVVS